MGLEIITESNDRVTDNVIEYLLASNIDFVRKNHEDFSNVSILLDNTRVRGVNKIWHRRAKRNFIPKEISNSPFLNYLKREEDPVNKAIEKIAVTTNPDNYVGGYCEEEQHNKIYDLHLAMRFGLKIPVTLVTNIKEDLIEFKKKHNKIITKAIKYPFFYRGTDVYYNCKGTFFVNQKDIDAINGKFFISVFQSYVEKKFEVRVFFYKNQYYSMAIFSQNDKQTKVDFRNYNQEKPNRCVPFKLPEKILLKLKHLMNYKLMSSGSIDLIVTPENDFVFLEVNPQGQFHWLSESCNYYIEKSIAQDLS